MFSPNTYKLTEESNLFMSVCCVITFIFLILQVAIKYIPKKKMHVVQIDGQAVPLEVVLMHRAGGDERSLGVNYAVSLIEWFELKDHVAIVMERPEDCMDLFDYIDTVPEVKLSEHKAKVSIQNNEH